MKKKISVWSVVILTILAIAITFSVTSVLWYVKTKPTVDKYNTFTKKYSKLIAVDALVNDSYIHDIDSEKLMDGILLGYMYGIEDKYGRYMPKETYQKYSNDNSDKFVGIGITVIPTDDGYLKITDVYKDSPALNNGVNINDIIVSVGDSDVSELGYYDAVSALQGEAGSTAQFSVLRSGKEISFTILRKQFKTYSVTSKILGGNIGYIKITQFKADSTYDEFKQQYDSLLTSGVGSIIFDVRGNPGGDLTAICNILDILLPKGPIIRIEDKTGKMEEIDSDENHMEIPAAVLINENTYSAAELFCSSLQDYQLATLVGKTTYGKGTMQFVTPLGDGSALSLSTRMYYPPFSDNYEGKGVVPDIEVENSDDEDLQLSKAVEILNK